MEAKLAQAKHRIAELEEAMEGKQLALGAAIKKSETANLQSVRLSVEQPLFLFIPILLSGILRGKSVHIDNVTLKHLI